jgi:hypothetical protein
MGFESPACGDISLKTPLFLKGLWLPPLEDGGYRKKTKP